ncbi:hypothetical protein GCM10009798_26990 [Nocardioides panacihumi]|uniref:SLATT domain-containing protein n=1 Tax=Nocardioides panacihumi TaxID=400774 RepID=A0ABN2R8F9_9ACTN
MDADEPGPQREVQPERDWDHIFDALSLEYGTLREELLEKTTRRAQTTAFMSAAAAALVAIASAKDADWVPLLVAVAAVFGVLAALTWVQNSRTIGRLSTHVAQLELDIDEAVNRNLAATQYLRWETEHQKRNWWYKLWYGAGRAPQSRADPEKDEAENGGHA